jgi:hypothetical protein
MCSVEIIAARIKSWAVMEERRHELLRVFTSKKDFSDLLLICKLKATLKNGNEVSGEFISHLVFKGDTSVDPKGSLYTIWNVSLAWTIKSFLSNTIRTRHRG